MLSTPTAGSIVADDPAKVGRDRLPVRPGPNRQRRESRQALTELQFLGHPRARREHLPHVGKHDRERLFVEPRLHHILDDADDAPFLDVVRRAIDPDQRADRILGR